MTNAERGADAGYVFQASEHARQNNDTLTNLYDFVCDLLHFADTVDDPYFLPSHTSGETTGQYVARIALWHYKTELSEEKEDN